MTIDIGTLLVEFLIMIIVSRNPTRFIHKTSNFDIFTDFMKHQQHSTESSQMCILNADAVYLTAYAVLDLRYRITMVEAKYSLTIQVLDQVCYIFRRFLDMGFMSHYNSLPMFRNQ